jgi:hypothetical protein
MIQFWFLNQHNWNFEYFGNGKAYQHILDFDDKTFNVHQISGENKGYVESDYLGGNNACSISKWQRF